MNIDMSALPLKSAARLRLRLFNYSVGFDAFEDTCSRMGAKVGWFDPAEYPARRCLCPLDYRHDHLIWKHDSLLDGCPSFGRLDASLFQDLVDDIPF